METIKNNSCKVMILAMLIRTKLREFLGPTNDYTAFMANLDTHNGRYPAHSVVWYLFTEFERHRHNLESVIPAVINNAFLWDYTPEGHSNWSYLDYTWREFVSNILASESLRKYFGINTQEELSTI